jgi:hypothetical protein
MKKFAILLTTLIFISIAPLSAHADCAGNSCSNVYVDILYVNASSSIYVGTSGDETLLNCEAHAGVYAILDSNHVNADKIYSTLLAAQLANKKVRVRISEGTEGCRISYITIQRQ